MRTCIKFYISVITVSEVEEVVNTIMFLLSDLAPIVNAVTLPIDGGFLAC